MTQQCCRMLTATLKMFMESALRENEKRHLRQDEAVVVQDSVAALSEGCLGSEVCDDVHQPVPQIGDLQPGRDLLHQPQRVDIAPYVIQQCPCIEARASDQRPAMLLLAVLCHDHAGAEAFAVARSSCGAPVMPASVSARLIRSSHSSSSRCIWTNSMACMACTQLTA